MSHLVVVVVLTLITTFFVRDLAKPGLPMMHDSNPHTSRMIAFHTALRDGQFPPMWAKEVLGGIGSPVMMLNYQLPYFMTEGMVRLGASYFASYKLVLGLSFVVSGILMYMALVRTYGRWAAWTGALIYTLAPYRFVDIFVRGALGESIAFMFPPLLIYGFAQSSYPILILGWAGLFLTHPVAAATFSAFFLGYTLLFGAQKQLSAKLKDFFGPYLVALAIAMFNLLPTLALTKYTYYDPSLSDTLLMFPTLGQLLHSPWGYGVSLPGTNDGMSFEIGVVGWVVLLLCTGWALWQRDKKLGYLSGAAWLTILLMLPISLPLYRLFLGQMIDFPWRLIMCMVFVTAWMGAELLHHLTIRPLNHLVTGLITIVLIVLSLPMAHTDKYWGADKGVAFFARETGDSYGEYAPRTRATRDSAPFGKRAEFIHSDGEISVIENKSNLQKFETNSEKPGSVRINTSYFPGWKITIDGVEQKIILPDCHDCGSNRDDRACFVSSRTLSHIDDSGLMECRIGAGKHVLTAVYVAPTVQRVGNLITLAGIGAYLWILFRSFYPLLTNVRR